MNSVLISIITIILIAIVGSLLGNFFDISMYIYMPYIVWGIGLCLFNIILEKVHNNKFMIYDK
jgi:hypothetical protein